MFLEKLVQFSAVVGRVVGAVSTVVLVTRGIIHQAVAAHFKSGPRVSAHGQKLK